MKFETVNDYSIAIADYLCDEYGDMSKQMQLTDDESRIAGIIVNRCYENADSVNNAAHFLLEFLLEINSKKDNNDN